MVNGSQRRVSKAAEVTLSSEFLIAVLGETWGYDMFLLCLLQYGVCVCVRVVLLSLPDVVIC